MVELLTLAGALTFGTLAFWGFWVGALVLTGLLIALAENENWGWATVLFAGTFCSLAFTGIFNLYKFTVQHPAILLEYVVGYLVIGLVWGAFKWWRYCVHQRESYNDARADFLKAYNATEMSAELRVKWTEKLKNASRFERYHVMEPPLAKNHKEKIVNWMYLWPFSILGTIFSDWVKEVFKWLYDRMGKVYDRIAAATFKGTEADLASEEDIAIVTAAQRNVAAVADALSKQARSMY